MPPDVETTELFEIPGYSPPAELQVYAPMGRIQLRIGQVIRYHHYETQACRYRLVVVTKNSVAIQQPVIPIMEFLFVHLSRQC